MAKINMQDLKYKNMFQPGAQYMSWYMFTNPDKKKEAFKAIKKIKKKR